MDGISSNPQPLSLIIVFENIENAALALIKLGQENPFPKEYAITYSITMGPDCVGLTVEACLPLTPDRIDEVREKLTRLTAKFGGKYLGWASKADARADGSQTI